MSQTPITRAAGRQADKRRHKRKNRFLKQSKRFIERDTPVFPVKANSKIPLTSNGFKDATTDLSQLEEWAEKFPDANIGIPTGGTSGFIVIDLDCKNGVDGIKEFASLCVNLGVVLPETYRVKTPSAGEHIYLKSKYSGLIRNSAGVLAPGVDVRGEGGYVVAPGSMIDGKKYEVIEGRIESMAKLPKKLRKVLQKKNRKRHASATNGNGRTHYHRGQRNELLFKDVCTLRATDKPNDKVRELAHRINADICVPPLDYAEVTKIVDSALSYEDVPKPNDDPETALTDMGNARRYAMANEGKLAHIRDLSKYVIRADGEHWRYEQGAEMVLAKAAARELLKKVVHIDDLKMQEAVSKHAIRSQSRHALEACVKLAQTEPELAMSLTDFDSDGWSLAVANGVVNLKGQIEFRKVQATDNFLKVAPIEYDLEAKCPLWLDFLELVQPNRVMRRYLQKLVGLTLVGSAAPEIIIFLYGVAGSGKSTFTNAVMRFLGRDLAVKIPTSVLLMRDREGSPNELLPLLGARMAVASEVPEGRKFNEARLKDLASKDPLTTRPLYAEAIQFEPSHTLWIYGNHLARVSGADTGIERRMHLLPFDQRIPAGRVDRFFDKKLEAELPGILNWALEGCNAWQRHGLKKPKRVKKATSGYLSEMDLFRQFITQRIVERRGEEVRASHVYSAYRDWATGQGERPVTNTKFGTAMVEREYRKVKREKGIFYLDIGVLRNEQ